MPYDHELEQMLLEHRLSRIESALAANNPRAFTSILADIGVFPPNINLSDLALGRLRPLFAVAKYVPTRKGMTDFIRTHVELISAAGDGFERALDGGLRGLVDSVAKGDRVPEAEAERRLREESGLARPEPLPEPVCPPGFYRGRLGQLMKKPKETRRRRQAGEDGSCTA